VAARLANGGLGFTRRTGSSAVGHRNQATTSAKSGSAACGRVVTARLMRPRVEIVSSAMSTTIRVGADESAAILQRRPRIGRRRFAAAWTSEWQAARWTPRRRCGSLGTSTRVRREHRVPGSAKSDSRPIAPVASQTGPECSSTRRVKMCLPENCKPRRTIGAWRPSSLSAVTQGLHRSRPYRGVISAGPWFGSTAGVGWGGSGAGVLRGPPSDKLGPAPRST